MHKFNKMAVKLVTQILLLCLVNVLEADNAAIHRQCPGSEIICFCGELPNPEVKVFEMQPELFQYESKDCEQLKTEVCANQTCLLMASIRNESKTEMAVKYYSFDLPNISLSPLDDDTEESHRMVRSARKCLTPIVNHASVDCNLWGEFYACDIKCNPGYAFEEDGKMVLKTKRVCRESKPVWLPKKTFPDCKAYINCKAVLVKPGKLECIPGPGIPYCDISCKMDYENGFGEVPLERFECVDEHFAETLPHCATSEKNMDMLKLSEKAVKGKPKTG